MIDRLDRFWGRLFRPVLQVIYFFTGAKPLTVLQWLGTSGWIMLACSSARQEIIAPSLGLIGLCFVSLGAAVVQSQLIRSVIKENAIDALPSDLPTIIFIRVIFATLGLWDVWDMAFSPSVKHALDLISTFMIVVAYYAADDKGGKSLRQRIRESLNQPKTVLSLGETCTRRSLSH